MRVALISDIHGNLPALEAVLAELGSAKPDHLICLGDVAIFGPQPRATLARVRDLAGPVIMGNTDAWALNPHPHPIRDEESVRFNELEAWGAAQLSPADRTYIATFRSTVELEVGDDMRLLCYHGSPRSYDESILATTPDQDLSSMVSESPATLLAGGHTHTQLVRRCQEKVIINPGSVGMPIEYRPGVAQARNPAWAEYAVIDWDSGHLTVGLHRTPFDVNALKRAVRESHMPHGDWWLQDWD